LIVIDSWAQQDGGQVRLAASFCERAVLLVFG
jgi:hypothetical protein